MKDELIKILSNMNLQYQHRQIEHLHPDIYKWIIDSTKQYNTSSIIESIYIILNRPPLIQCQYSNNIAKKFISFSKGYSKFCLNNCKCLVEFKQRKLGNLSDEENEIRKNKRKQTNLEKYGVEHLMHSDEIKEKLKTTNLEKYGVENPFQLPEIRAKAIQTHLERYGVTSFIGTHNVQEKIRHTNLEKFGVEYPMQSDEIRKKSIETLQNRYGVDNPMCIESVREKAKQTNLELYGTEHPQKLEEIKNKVTQTNLEKYGVKYPSQLQEFKEKSIQSSMDRWGVDNPSKSVEIKETIKRLNLEKYGVKYFSQAHLPNSTLEILNDKQLFANSILDKTINEVCSNLSISVTTVLVYARKYQIYNLLNTSRSSYELLIENFLNKNNIEHITNTRSIIKPWELDFYLPKHRLAIEVGSAHFHSEIAGNKDKNYHYNKWKLCKDQNITLLQYFDINLFENWSIVESKIKRLCNIKLPIIGSRKLELAELNDYAIESKFLNENHLQGATSKRNIVIGAYYRNELVAVSTWLIKDNVTELVRYATNINNSYPGLFSRMLVKFKILTNFKGTLISFSDNRHSNGKLYLTVGFRLESTGTIGYSYSKDGYTLESRLKYQKHKLQKIFNLTDEYINIHTEWQIMQEQGYDRLWDAGQSKWTMTI